MAMLSTESAPSSSVIVTEVTSFTSFSVSRAKKTRPEWPRLGLLPIEAPLRDPTLKLAREPTVPEAPPELAPSPTSDPALDPAFGAAPGAATETVVA
eukprot:scaffold1381_cov111-Isochrysis_galbana.AAC.3